MPSFTLPTQFQLKSCPPLHPLHFVSCAGHDCATHPCHCGQVGVMLASPVQFRKKMHLYLRQDSKDMKLKVFRIATWSAHCRSSQGKPVRRSRSSSRTSWHAKRHSCLLKLRHWRNTTALHAKMRARLVNARMFWKEDCRCLQCSLQRRDVDGSRLRIALPSYIKKNVWDHISSSSHEKTPTFRENTSAKQAYVQSQLHCKPLDFSQGVQCLHLSGR